MARPRVSVPPLDYLRVRVPVKLKTDLETIVSFKETTMSDVLRTQIEDYLGRQQLDDDPIFPNDLAKQRPRGGHCVDYIRFQLPAILKNDFQDLIEKRGLVSSAVLRLMAEHYVASNKLEDVLLEFKMQSDKERAIVG